MIDSRMAFSVILSVIYSLVPAQVQSQESVGIATSTKGASESRSVAERIDAFLVASGVRGGILIAKDGEVLLANGYGGADDTRKIPITPKTVFDIGSVTKQFTGAAILKLQEEGKLRVHDLISKFFQDVPPDKQSITLHHLLTHTAGFEHDVVNHSEYPTRDEAVKRVLSSKLKLKPGEKYSYSNAGYALLAATIEIASGMNYEDYLHAKLWAPAGMYKTGYILPLSPDEIAHGFDPCGEIQIPRSGWPADGPSWGVRGAGAVLSTLEDLYRWQLSFGKGKILTKESEAQLFRPHVPEDSAGASHYGYGWAIFKTPRQTRLIAHDGSNGTFFADFHRYVDENVTILFFTSERNSTSKQAFRSAISAFFSGAVEPVPVAKWLPDKSELKQYAGTYILPDGKQFTLDLEGRQLSTKALEFGVTRLFTTFPRLQPSERLVDLNSKTEKILAKLVDGDLEQIHGQMYYDGSLDDEKAYWKQTSAEWKSRFGTYQKSEIVGSTVDKEFILTYVLLEFERGPLLLQFRQNANGKFFIGTGNTLLTGNCRLIPQTPTRFVVYNFSLRTTTSIDFKLSGKDVVGLTIADDEGDVYARKQR